MIEAIAVRLRHDWESVYMTGAGMAVKLRDDQRPSRKEEEAVVPLLRYCVEMLGRMAEGN